MAYALQSLITILQKLLNSQQTLWILDHNKPQLESLLQKATSLQQILDKSLLTKIELLESQIRDAAHEAEDIIESHMVDQMLSIPLEAEDIIESHMVDRLTGDQRKLEIVPVVGKPRIGYKMKAVLLSLLHRKWWKKSDHHAGEESHEAEDIIESHMVDQMLSNPEAVGLTFSTPDLQPIMQQLDSVMEQVVKHVEGKTGSSSGASSSRNVDSVRPKVVVGVDGDLMQLTDRLTGDMKKLEIVEGSSSSGASFSRNVDSVRSKALVGVDGDLMQLRDRLTGDMRKQLEIVPIVGMGGIGKTTLARKLYEDLASHFKPAHAWATVSQDYDMRAILLSLLKCIIGENESKKHAAQEIHELKVILHQSLCGRRYMIVLDDIWSIQFWDEIRNYFPEHNNGSRIMITTRESEVAKHASLQSVPHQMHVLNKFESWNLLRQEVFGDQEVCPHFLQEIGENISRDCGGLPLAINVIGGLLSKVERSISVWDSIAKNVASAIAEADEQFSHIFSLSYSHLPNHLKPCFLYMGAFPEDHKIEGSKLVLLWMAEGFMKSNGNKSLEEEAEDCLKALVERNLIFVSRYYLTKPMEYGMHDLLRDLCIRKSTEDKFFYVGNGRVSDPRRMCVADKSFEDNVTEECITLVRSFIIKGWDEILWEDISYVGNGRVNFELFRLVRVLDVYDFKFKEFPTEILQLVNLRFLAVWCYNGGIPSGISRLKNLQTLTAWICSYGYLTSEIFAMSELRHVQIGYSFWLGEEDMKAIAPNKLQRVSEIRITESLIRRGFLESIPDIKHLEFELTTYAGAVDLTHLHKLERLRIVSDISAAMSDRLSKFAFPSGLRKLSVTKFVMFPSVMTTLCALPNLEELQIWSCDFPREGDDDDDDGEWEVAEGDEFPSLQVLHLWSDNLVRWRADETNFPRLRHLELFDCGRLEEIPSGIGEIPTLEIIKLKSCSSSAWASARRIVEEQQSVYGNYTLQFG